MAIVWTYATDDTRYEVRAAGSSLRFYSNGVLHSQYSERCPLTGSVWDLLWLPALFRPARSPRRILLLGTGAGTVIRQLKRLFDPIEIVGVDNNPIHLRVAREHFGVTPEMAQLLHADAGDYVARYRGPGFDLVIDDLFGGGNGVPERSVRFDSAWLRKLQRCLTDEGVLSINFADRAELVLSGFSRALNRGDRFLSMFEFTAPAIENVIVGLLPFTAQSADLRAYLQATPELANLLERGRLRYRVKTVKLKVS